MQRKIAVEDGVLKAIYSDELLPYIERIQAEFGLPADSLEIRRATRVEPDPDRTRGGNWLVDLTPVGGPVCYDDEKGNPFIKRQEAIDFELRWLDAHWLSRRLQDVSAVTQEE